jgi:choline dehydrogenase
MTITDKSHFDTIIVGAGSSGCLLANRLSANPNHKVLLIEAGGKDDWIWIKIPVGYLFTINNPRTDWCFKTQPDPGLNGRSIHYARGRVLGGSSSINAMIYMRGQESDYQKWIERTGDTIWDWKHSLDTYKSIESYFGGNNQWHGSDGEMRVEQPRVQWPILDSWRMAASEQGIPSIEEFNRGDNEGCAYFHMNQKKGIRWSMSDAFLKPIKHRKNLTIMTNSQVLKVLTKTITNETLNQSKNRERAWASAKLEAYGLKILHKGEQITVTASDQVILAAGAVSSPHLLQVSGIGPVSLINSIGVEPVHDLPGVGENLQDHLQIRTVYKVSNCKTVNTLYKNIFSRMKMVLEYALFRTGPMTMPPSTLGAFAKSDETQTSANLEWHVQPLSLPKFGDPLHSYNAITPSVCNIRPTSRGWIKAVSSNPLKYPKILCNYLSTKEDLDVAVAGLKKTREIMQSKSLMPFAPEEILPGPNLQTDQDLQNAARDLGTTIFHPVGTCAMGKVNSNGVAEDLMTVLDSECRVRGISKLRVIDASAMPSITSGNTNAPVMLIAETIVKKILNTN